jgi:hypothetical protein
MPISQSQCKIYCKHKKSRSSYTLRCRGYFFILVILQTVGLLGWVISSSQDLYLTTGQHKHRINAYTYQTSMPCVWFEPTIPASERTKTVHALHRSATVTDRNINKVYKILMKRIQLPSHSVGDLVKRAVWKNYDWRLWSQINRMYLLPSDELKTSLY